MFWGKMGIVQISSARIAKCAYELIESDLNIPVTEISAHLGHAQTSTTLNIYAPAFQRRQAKVTKALGNIFETIENKAHA